VKAVFAAWFLVTRPKALVTFVTDPAKKRSGSRDLLQKFFLFFALVTDF
jgi:hypothetical protein